MAKRAGASRFPQWLRDWLKEHRDAGWTQARIAQAMGISQPQVSNWMSEANPRRPEMETLVRLAAVLHEPLDELLTVAGYVAPPDLGPLAADYAAGVYEYARELQALPAEKRTVVERLIEVLRDPNARVLPGSTGARVLVAA